MIVADEAAVDDVGGAGAVGAVVGGEEEGYAGDVFGGAEAAEGMLARRALSSDLSAIILVLIGVAMAPGAMLLTVML